MAVAGGTLEVSGCTFVDQRRGGGGGAIRAINATVEIRSSTFTDVVARLDGGADGTASGRPLGSQPRRSALRIGPVRWRRHLRRL